MTREEAIKVLEDMPIPPMDGYDFYDISEALNMAIEALKREDTMLKEIERVVLYGERSEANE